MIIVNFSTQQYIRGQRRLNDSIPKNYNRIMFTSFDEIGSPTHQESPYEFKVHAIRKAAEIDPVVLWVDASMYCVGDLKKIEDIILRDGYFAEEAGHWVGSWCNEHTRNYFKLTADEGKVPGGFNMFSAGLLGLDFQHPIAMQFLYMWSMSAKNGCFKGDWSDHRHDMSAGSIIASRLGMKYQTGGTHLAYVGPGYSAPKPSVVFYCQGL